MQQFYKFITWRFVSLNMFRALPRPSLGAYNCINSLWFYRWIVGGSSAVGRGLAGRPDHDQQRYYHQDPTVKPEAANAVICSWWWAWKRPKHVEPHINVK